MTKRKHGAIYRPAPLCVRPWSRLTGGASIRAAPRADWHAKAPADGNPLGNDRFGCCVEAADFQVIRMRRANAWGDEWKPTPDVVLKRYAAMTGFDPAKGIPDLGTDTASDMATWCSKGIRIDSQNEDVPFWIVLNPHDLNAVNAAIEYLGPILLTMALPSAAENPASWSIAPGTGPGWEPGSLGYHRTIAGKYDGAIRTTRTWGRDYEMHPEFWSRYVVGADATISREWLDTTGRSPSNIDWNELLSDRSILAAT